MRLALHIQVEHHLMAVMDIQEGTFDPDCTLPDSLHVDNLTAQAVPGDTLYCPLADILEDPGCSLCPRAQRASHPGRTYDRADISCQPVP